MTGARTLWANKSHRTCESIEIVHESVPNLENKSLETRPNWEDFFGSDFPHMAIKKWVHCPANRFGDLVPKSKTINLSVLITSVLVLLCTVGQFLF